MVTNAALNMGAQMSVRVPAFSSFAYKPEEELLALTIILCVTFAGPAVLFPTAAADFSVPASDAQGFQFFHIGADAFLGGASRTL